MSPTVVRPRPACSFNVNWRFSAWPFFILLATTQSLSAAPARQTFLDRYCTSCHNQKSKIAGLVLESSDPDHPAKHPEIWEKVVRKLELGEMPPAGMPQPGAEVRKTIAAGVIEDLDAAALKAPYAGRP